MKKVTASSALVVLQVVVFKNDERSNVILPGGDGPPVDAVHVPGDAIVEGLFVYVFKNFAKFRNADYVFRGAIFLGNALNRCKIFVMK